jgi:hypothetical protein
MAAGEGNHVFILIDGEVFHLFREVPQADDIRLPGEDFFLHVEEHFRQRLPDSVLRPRPIKLSPQNIQHGGAVIHGVAFGGHHLLLRLVAAQNEEQVAAILLVEASQALFFIARWSEETTMTVFLNRARL